jgi:VWFA-related protein
VELPLVAAGQPQAIPSFSSGVDVVQFTVTVLDKDRHPITGLAADDFEVLVDGKPKPLAAFAAVTLPDEAPNAEARVPPIPVDVQTNELPSEGRVVIIVLDRSTPTGHPMRAARDAANGAIDRLGPADLGAVVFTARGMKRYSQGLTADRTRLHAAVAAALIGAGEEPGEKIPIAAGMDKGTNAAAAAEGGSSGGGAAGPPAARAEKPANRMPLASEADSGECYCGVCVPDGLTALAQMLSRAPGRYKSVLFIGSDIALSSRDPASQCAAVIQPARERLSRALDVANVRVDAIDPRGLEPLGGAAELGAPVGVSEQRVNQFRQSSLAVLPEYTGGRLIMNDNRPAEKVGAIFDESRSYYVLALARDTAAAGVKENRRQIKIVVKRADATVRSRSMYFVAGSEAVARPSANAAASALSGLLPRSEFPLQLNLVPWFSADGAPEVHVLLAAPTGLGSRLDALIGAFDNSGDPVGTLLQQHLNVPAAARAAGASFQWTSVLTPPPGRYEVRAGVATPDGTRAASVYGDVDVPDVAKLGLAMSGIVVKSGGAATVQRTFGPGATIGLSFQVAHAGTDLAKVTVRYSLSDAAGQALEDVAVPHDRAAAASAAVDVYDIGVRVPATRGQYVVMIGVTDGHKPLERRVLFTVR